MALFGKKKNTKEKVVSDKPAKKVKAVAIAPKENSSSAVKTSGINELVRMVLVGPLVTEKVTMLNETRNVYTFEIGRSATKKSISEVIQNLYKVTPEKIRVLPITRKKVFVRGKVGYKGGGRKAYIYLKSGDKMDTA